MSELLLGGLLRQAAWFSIGVALLWALRPLLKRLGAGALYAAWLLVPALLLMPYLPRPGTEPLRVMLQAANASTLPAAAALPALPTTSAPLWLALWLIGAAALLSAQGWRQWQLARLGALLPAGSSPALVGLLRPRVALPADFEQRFPPAQRMLILAHEQVHRERHDNLWNLLACALAALHWWNPLAWWAARRFRADQELACDAAVLAVRPGAQADYTLALLAAHDLDHLGAPLASRWCTTHPLIERIAMLKQPSPLNRRRTWLLAGVIAALSTLAYAAEAPGPTGARFIEVQLVVERTGGGEKTRIQTRLVGRDGERMKVGFDAIGDGTANWTTEPLWINLQPQRRGEAVLIRTELQSGTPAVEIGSPSVMSAWGMKARIELSRPQSDEKLALELTATLAPVDFQPPKNAF